LNCTFLGHSIVVAVVIVGAQFTDIVVRFVLRHVLRQKLRCCKMIIQHVLSQFTKFVLGDPNIFWM